jgi:hypothetical protein
MPVTSQKGIFMTIKSSSTRNTRVRTEHVNVTTFFGDRSSSTGLAVADHVEHLPPPACNDINEQEGAACLTKRQRLEEDCGLIQEELITVGLSSEIPASSSCQICGQQVALPIRCSDCNTFFICCELCEVKVHGQVFHKPEI